MATGKARKKRLQKKESPKAIEEGNEDLLFEVEAILDDKVVVGRKWYLIKWKGFSSDQNSWEPLDNLGCPLLLGEYEKRKSLQLKSKPKGLRPEFGPEHLLPEPVREFHPDTPHKDLWLQTLSQSRYNIRVTNTVDDSPPTQFLWLDECLLSGAPNLELDSTIGCNCVNDCDPELDEACSCLSARTGLIPYDKHGCVRYSPIAAAIYECNVKCLCSIYCPNRVTQRIPKIVFDIFRTLEKGWGVRSLEPLRKGQFITKYVGEIITEAEASVRNSNYMFDIDFWAPGESKYVIDASKVGNICRFFNHSCEPNMATYSVFIETDDLFRHELAFFTTRAIDANEELTLDYGGFNCELKFDESIYEKCHCGTPSCRGHLPLVSPENIDLS